jgi:hypothetical protein
MTRSYWRHRYVLPVASRVVPEWALRLLNRYWRVDFDPTDGWTFWLDASYARWCRRDAARGEEQDA